MIEKICLRNFRNFSQREISFSEGKNIIIGKNGYGKSNILEALSLPLAPLVETHSEYLLERGKEVFFIQYHLSYGVGSFAYERDTKKRKYTLGEKTTTKKKLTEFYPHIVTFHPIMMNMMYLGPSERRNFLDIILSQSFTNYSKLLGEYKKVVTHRNRVLKNIFENKSQSSELEFWNTKFVTLGSEIYSYRKHLIDYFSQNAQKLEKYFFGKIQTIAFHYESKTDISDPKNSLATYLEQNTHKEILSRKTLRGPHLDDFNIIIDDIPLIHFASRGEVKSIILGLKFLESNFIEETSPKHGIVFLIDDLLSELDIDHRNLLWEHIGNRQSIITSIEDFDVAGNKIFV